MVKTKESKGTSMIEKLNSVTENKLLKEEIESLRAWKAHAKQMLKIYDDLGEDSEFFLLLDALSDYFVGDLQRKGVPISREHIVDLKVFLSTEIHKMIPAKIHEFFSPKKK